MYIEVTVVARIPVEDLSHYEASSIGEAAKNQASWCDNGECSFLELLEFAEIKSLRFDGVDD